MSICHYALVIPALLLGPLTGQADDFRPRLIGSGDSDLCSTVKLLNKQLADPTIPREAAATELVKRSIDISYAIRAGKDEGLRLAVLESVKHLAEMLRDKDWPTRLAAASALARLGPWSSGAVAALAGAAEDERAHVRAAVAEALGEIGPPAAVPVLVKAVDDPDEDVQKQAMIALGRVGPEAKVAVPRLVCRLKDRGEPVNGSEPPMSTFILIALSGIGPGAEGAVDEILKGLSSKDRAFRGMSIGALGQIGKAEDKVMPVLLAILNDPDEAEYLRAHAARSIGGFRSEAAREALVKLLGHQSTDIVSAAATALGEIGPTAAKSALPGLIKIVEDPAKDPKLRRTCIIAIGRMAAEAKAAIPALEKVSGEDSLLIGGPAKGAIQRIKAAQPKE
jgi:HEAT repeat protein